jgi:NAD(P)H-nitrite reductase large subunit
MSVVVIGSGLAGVSFAEKYRSLNPTETITLLSRESDGYYSRPLLSRGFSKSNIEQSIILKTFAQLQESQIEVISNAEVSAIDPINKTITYQQLNQTVSINYDKLILGPGSAAFIPPPFLPYTELFFCLNSLTDLKQIRRFRQTFLEQNRHPHWAVVGGGLIGCEISSDLAVSGDKVTLFHAMDRLMERQLDTTDSERLLAIFQEGGVEVRLNQAIRSFSKQGDKVLVNSTSSSEFDGLLVCCGFKPRTELAEQAGLTMGRGIKVNEFLQTSDSAIYAIGDAAELPNGKLYAFVLPIRSQAFWLANYLNGQTTEPWQAPAFSPQAKVHGFEAVHPMAF